MADFSGNLSNMPPFFFLLLVVSLAHNQADHRLPIVDAAPVKTFRDYTPNGPSGNLDPRERMRDTFGTATQIWQRGPLPRLSTVSALRTGPVSEVYRSTLTSSASKTCEPGSNQKCEVAINGFGTVGEVQYNFSTTRHNLKGRSTQVMVACRCLSKECEVAVLVRPINVVRKTPDGKMESTGQTCLYEAVDNKFSDCHSELLRVSQRERNVLQPEYMHKDKRWNYTVQDQDHPSSDFWTANGQRGWTLNCTDTELGKLDPVSLSKLSELAKQDKKSRDIEFNVHVTAPGGPHCTAPRNVKYFREDHEGGATCAEIYEYAASAAANRGTQQDEIAVGKLSSTYITAQPELTTDTELALSLSAAGLGILFVWSMYRKQIEKRNVKTPIKYLTCGVMKQVFSYALEALPLHIALGQEISARNWVSLFAFADATVSLAEDLTKPQGSAAGSVLVLVGVLGEVRYLSTREVMIAVFTALFDLTACGIIATTIVRKVRHLAAERRRVMYDIDSGSDVTDSSEGSTTKPRMRVRRRRRRRLPVSSPHTRKARSSKSSEFRANDDVSALKAKVSLSSLSSSCDSPSRSGSAFSNAEWEEFLAAECQAATFLAAQCGEALDLPRQDQDIRLVEAGRATQDIYNAALLAAEAAGQSESGTGSHEPHTPAANRGGHDMVVFFEGR